VIILSLKATQLNLEKSTAQQRKCMPAVQFFLALLEMARQLYFLTKAQRLHWTTERHVVLINSL